MSGNLATLFRKFEREAADTRDAAQQLVANAEEMARFAFSLIPLYNTATAALNTATKQCTELSLENQQLKGRVEDAERYTEQAKALCDSLTANSDRATRLRIAQHQTSMARCETLETQLCHCMDLLGRMTRAQDSAERSEVAVRALLEQEEREHAETRLTLSRTRHELALREEAYNTACARSRDAEVQRRVTAGANEGVLQRALVHAEDKIYCLSAQIEDLRDEMDVLRMDWCNGWSEADAWRQRALLARGAQHDAMLHARTNVSTQCQLREELEEARKEAAVHWDRLGRVETAFHATKSAQSDAEVQLTEMRFRLTSLQDDKEAADRAHTQALEDARREAHAALMEARTVPSSARGGTASEVTPRSPARSLVPPSAPSEKRARRGETTGHVFRRAGASGADGGVSTAPSGPRPPPLQQRRAPPAEVDVAPVVHAVSDDGTARPAFGSSSALAAMEVSTAPPLPAVASTPLCAPLPRLRKRFR